MKRRFFDSKNNRFLHLTIHSPGLYLYGGKPINAKLLKALQIHEAPLVGPPPTAQPLTFGDYEPAVDSSSTPELAADSTTTTEIEQTPEVAEVIAGR